MQPLFAILALAAFLTVSEMDYRDYVLAHAPLTIAQQAAP